MKRMLSTVACAAAILLSSASIDALMAPAAAQMDADFDTFHDQLAPYGDWLYSDRWGEVWVPFDVPDDFRPYDTNGYWAYTDEYGWYWVSNFDWGDIAFHYGRWVNDPDIGWLWIPGYVWSPAWVVWRSNGRYTGWMPMPPDQQFLGYPPQGPSFGISLFGGALGFSVDYNDTSNYYGYGQWYGGGYDQNAFAANWVFVDTGHMADRDFHRYGAPRGNYITLINNSRNITNYTIVNNYVVNRSVDPGQVARFGGRPVVTVHVAQVAKHPQFIMSADHGRQVQERMRQQMPRGTGLANSAPKPSPKVVQSLSTNVRARNANVQQHLFTRDAVTKSPEVFKGPKGGSPAMGGPKGGTMGGPNPGPGGPAKGPNAGPGGANPNAGGGGNMMEMRRSTQPSGGPGAGPGGPAKGPNAGGGNPNAGGGGGANKETHRHTPGETQPTGNQKPNQPTNPQDEKNKKHNPPQP